MSKRVIAADPDAFQGLPIIQTGNNTATKGLMRVATAWKMIKEHVRCKDCKTISYSTHNLIRIEQIQSMLYSKAMLHASSSAL